MVRTRLSLQEVVNKYDTGEDPTILENLIRAFRKIQALPSSKPDSFFTIAGYHGEPFVSQDPDNPDWWGGYCQHETVLFPMWHRAYLLRIEEALRNVMAGVDLFLPYWDECLAVGSDDNPVPWILTAPTFDLDGDTSNPLHSYTLQASIANSPTEQARYAKHEGYVTVRYPRSGLVGTPGDIEKTAIHNAAFEDPDTNAAYLNANVKAWLDGTVQILPDKDTPNVPDTYSVDARYKISLDAPNYTVFSNKASMAQWVKEQSGSGHGYALEDGHNAIHLAVGGFYEKNKYNADPIRGANGDMGDNETAGFDPIFYFHHAFVDYVFWTWQKKHDATAKGSIAIDPTYDGTTSQGNPGVSQGHQTRHEQPAYAIQEAQW